MNAGDRQILDTFAAVRAGTIELARRVPDEWLARVADGETQPLSFLLCHAGCGEAWWMSSVLKDGGDERHPTPELKQPVVAAIESARRRVLDYFAARDGQAMGAVFTWTDEHGVQRQWVGRGRVLYYIGHEIHHRGKIDLALRQWGMTQIPFSPF